MWHGASAICGTAVDFALSLHTLKNRLIAHFGRGKYYRFYREESYLSPDDQAYIRSIFRQYNIQGEPAFDSYSEEYSW